MSQPKNAVGLLLTYLKVLLYMLTALLVRLFALAPLYVLTLNGSVRFVALLCPLLMVFVVLPLRYSFAEGLMQPPFTMGAAYSFADYGEKLSESIKHALSVLKWGLPLVALAGAGYYWYSQVDALTALQTITGLGAWWTNTRSAIIGFFGGQATPSANTMMDGLLVVGLVAVLAVLIWMYGAVRNSATRYIWVLADRGERKPRIEVRRRLMGRRFAQLGIALVNLILWMPFVLVSLHALKGVVSNLSTTLMLAATTGKLVGLDLASLAMPLVKAFALLYLPLLPLRRMNTAAFAARERKGAA